ncbi:MAG: hypothetical protein ACLUFL_02160 [Flavonifractor plautii]
MQEAVDMTYAAFDYAQQDRNPVLILTDGVMGTIMEPVALPPERSAEEVRALKEQCRSWAAIGHDSYKEPRATIDAGRWDTKEQERHCKRPRSCTRAGPARRRPCIWTTRRSWSPATASAGVLHARR